MSAGFEMKEFLGTVRSEKPESISLIIIALLVLLVMAGKLLLLFSIPVGQDEFNYLSLVHEYANGTLSTSWQSIHVHFFQWLPLAGSNEVDQAMAARTVMFLCFIGSAVFLFLLAKQFLSIGGSLFSVICYISLTTTIINGASFRSDTPAIFLIMLSIWLFVARGRSSLANAASGFALALAALFTVKSGLYLILFGALVLVRLRPLTGVLNDWKRFIPSVWFTAALAGGFALFHLLHVSTLASVSGTHQGQFIPSTYSSFIDLSGLFPGFEYLHMTVRNNPLIWSLFAAGLILYIIDLCVPKDNRSAPPPHLWIFLLPLLSLLVYRNTFPYFYVFIMPCAMLLCGYAADRLASFSKAIHPKASLIPLVLFALAIGFIGIIRVAYIHLNVPDITSRQRELLTLIHRIFPEPVAYLDGCRMVSSFPNAGLFLSSAGMRSYLQSNIPLIKDQIIGRQPLFLIANVPHLDINSAEPPKSARGLALHQDDWEALRTSYIHHWGPLWIMGKHFVLTDDTLRREFVIVAEGLYTVETDMDVLLDNKVYKNGMVVELHEGKHTIEVISTNAMVILRWGDHLYRPDTEPSWQDLFMGPFM